MWCELCDERNRNRPGMAGRAPGPAAGRPGATRVAVAPTRGTPEPPCDQAAIATLGAWLLAVALFGWRKPRWT
jgi:hypothetical protein